MGVESSQPTHRIAYMDIAKGIGILLVILAHNYIKLSVPNLGNFIFSFHMPFFFMVSGTLFNPTYSLTVLFKRRFATFMGVTKSEDIGSQSSGQSI